MRTMFLGVTLFCMGQLSAGKGQFPYLHVYLNTPNCYGHAAGVMMLDSIDQRCAKAVFLPERGQALRAQLASTLGLEPNSIAVHTLPTDQFNRSLWQGGFSRFVFGLGQDTIYDTNLDFLFQYADSINARIASADPPEMLRVEGELNTSGSVTATVDGNGDLLLLDEFLGRANQCTLQPAKKTLFCKQRTLQAQHAPPAMDPSSPPSLFDREVRYSTICQQRSKGAPLALFASVRTGVDQEGYVVEQSRLLLFPTPGQPSQHGFVPLDGFSVGNDGGATLNDTLYVTTYDTTTENYDSGFGRFVRRGDQFVQLPIPAKAEPFPAAIQEKLQGNFTSGFFRANWHFFANMPLAYNCRTGKYHDLGALCGVPLDTVVNDLSRYKFGTYYCSDALVEGDVITLLVYRNQEVHHLTADLQTRKVLSSGKVPLPNGYYLALQLLDAEHVLYVSDDQLHAWVLPLK